MTGMELFFGALSAVGTVLSAAGSIAAGQAQAEAAEFNAEVAEQQAAAERDAAASEAKDFRRREMRQVSAARAARLATGVTLAGSPLLVDSSTVREIALGSSRLRHAGEMRGNRLDNEAQLERARAKSAVTASYLQAGSSLLGGFSSWGSNYMDRRPAQGAYA